MNGVAERTLEHDPTAIDQRIEAQADRMHQDLVELISGSHVGLDVQPMHEIVTGSLLGAEALARFPGPLRPAEWFRVAHAIGLGHDLELRVVHEVIARSSGMSGMLSVNVSPQVIADPRLLGLLRQLGGRELMIEITDQTTMPELSMLRSRLDEIRSLGIRVATHVGEFGPEALRTLLIAQPDIVKLRYDLTSSLAAGHVETIQTRNFFACCRQAGVFIVAVGVETRDQLAVLERLGVDGYQGFITRGANPLPRRRPSCSCSASPPPHCWWPPSRPSARSCRGTPATRWRRFASSAMPWRPRA